MGLSCSNVAFPEGAEGSLEAKVAIGEAALYGLRRAPGRRYHAQLDQRQSPPHKSVTSCSFKPPASYRVDRSPHRKKKARS